VSALKICPTCTATYPVTERFCPKDGTALRSDAAVGADLVGSVIAERYHVLKKLGEGGMGQVYLAEHVKMGRQSAVKVLHPSMVHNADALGRFNREAANASRIDHPNVAGIYDFGETPEGLVYLAMQYVDGEPLSAILQKHGALAPSRVAALIRQIADGLHAAHALGIVHRDLKPDNIMVSRDADGLECVKVVDFGIAKASGSTSQKVTRTGSVMGTPEYMSPEQLAGDAVDARSDLYSLALVAFSMLTGELPFPAETTQTAMVMRLTEEPRSLAQMKPGIAWPSDVQAVMSKALDRNSSRRYADTREFARALHAAIETMPAPASATSSARTIDGTPAPAIRAHRRAWHAPMVAAAAAAAVLVIVTGSLLLAHATTASSLLGQGIAAYNNGRRAAAAERFLTAVKNAPADPMPHVYLSRMAREAKHLDTANAEAVRAVQLGPANALALRELASTLFELQDFAGARSFYVRALQHNPGDRLSQGMLGCALIRLGRLDEGTRWLKRAGNGSWSICAPAVAMGSP
jgi:serine/threonine protein kinase